LFPSSIEKRRREIPSAFSLSAVVLVVILILIVVLVLILILILIVVLVLVVVLILIAVLILVVHNYILQNISFGFPLDSITNISALILCFKDETNHKTGKNGSSDATGACL